MIWMKKKFHPLKSTNGLILKIKSARSSIVWCIFILQFQKYLHFMWAQWHEEFHRFTRAVQWDLGATISLAVISIPYFSLCWMLKALACFGIFNNEERSAPNLETTKQAKCYSFSLKPYQCTIIIDKTTR